MYKLTGLILCLLLVSQAFAQASTSTCSVSNVNGIASGLVTLGVPTAPLAQTSYSLSLAGFNLGLYAEVFSAFAIAGFQAASNQQFYSLVVDTIIFSNGNTQLNFTMNYLYNNKGINFQTSWSSIKLSWLAVSTLFETVVPSDPLGGSYIWATSVGLYPPFSDATGAILSNSPFITQPTAAGTSAACGFINSSPGYFDTVCSGSTASFETHTYIMGFQFNPAGSYTLAAAALLGNGGSTLADADEALTIAGGDFVLGAPLSGPKILVKGFGGQLQYVKIGIVITIILDRNNYLTANPAGFQYSGIYMPYTLFNANNPLQ